MSEDLKTMKIEGDIASRDQRWFALQRVGDTDFIEDTLTLYYREGPKAGMTETFKRRFLLSLIEKIPTDPT